MARMMQDLQSPLPVGFCTAYRSFSCTEATFGDQSPNYMNGSASCLGL
ncbi:MAG: hypothetical protein AVDCRST_MAG25-2270 [uncultured Rubrobacteraceae bacterium]|uniref:Uncharacterized protein n=1 Tax=uncultured Rubrobacteraceae bacterium TaxID=349277 RepID=A0A6J4RIE4_9ACTN|nr:MAG: hypothetical protein AVDCRST_MAG25-2270 [uncultured Rubrobacteraceae bacterium]